jgi:hypothetical protein
LLYAPLGVSAGSETVSIMVAVPSGAKVSGTTRTSLLLMPPEPQVEPLVVTQFQSPGTNGLGIPSRRVAWAIVVLEVLVTTIV